MSNLFTISNIAILANPMFLYYMSNVSDQPDYYNNSNHPKQRNQYNQDILSNQTNLSTQSDI